MNDGINISNRIKNVKPPSILAVIPARGGSKRLPRKNILDLNGKPLISYTIEAALQSNYIAKTIVTSDSDEVLEIASKFQSDTIKRPQEFASDTATTFDAIEHTILNQNKTFDYIILLQPTSPLRTSKNIDDAIELLIDKKADGVISVCEVDHPVQWNMPLENDLEISKFINSMDSKRSQEQEKHYRLNGAIYIANTKKLLQEKTFFLKSNIFASIMDKKNSIDIDDQLDFKFANFLISHQ